MKKAILIIILILVVCWGTLEIVNFNYSYAKYGRVDWRVCFVTAYQPLVVRLFNLLFHPCPSFSGPPHINLPTVPVVIPGQ